jgi:hypothetical protein
LQSRLYNVLKQGFVDVYLANGSPRERTYAVENTSFLVAQYFCWSELFRREVQFTDLIENPRAKGLVALQDGIVTLWGTDQYPPELRLFAGEQRAIGEAMIQASSRGSECMGYGAFLQKFKPGEHDLIDALKADVAALPSKLPAGSPRLRLVQNDLIDLLTTLDPDFARFPADKRSKV